MCSKSRCGIRSSSQRPANEPCGERDTEARRREHAAHVVPARVLMKGADCGDIADEKERQDHAGGRTRAKEKANTSTWNMLIPESPAFPMPTPRAATSARIHSPIDTWGLALHHTELAGPPRTSRVGEGGFNEGWQAVRCARGSETRAYPGQSV